MVDEIDKIILSHLGKNSLAYHLKTLQSHLTGPGTIPLLIEQ